MTDACPPMCTRHRSRRRLEHADMPSHRRYAVGNDMGEPLVSAAMRGDFWLADDPARRLQGEVDFAAGVLTVHGAELVDCVESSHDPQKDLTTLEPRGDMETRYLVHGETEDGTRVSVTEAVRGGCHHGAGSQNFLFLVALLGGHVSSGEHYNAAVLTLPEALASWLAHAGETALVLGDAEQAHIRLSDDVRFIYSTGASLQWFERTLVNPLLALGTIVVGRRVSASQLEMSTLDGVKVVVRRKETEPETTNPARGWALVPFAAIGLDGLKRWYELTTSLNPLVMVVAKTLTQPSDIEVKVLSLAASLEALHNKRHDKRALSRSDAKDIRTTASQAVKEEHRQRVYEALAQIGSMTFSERLQDLCSRLDGLGTALCGSEQDVAEQGGTTRRQAWLKAIRNARNGFAHMLPDTPTDLAAYSARLYVLYESMRWLTTATLLVEVGVPVPAVERAFQRQSSYLLFRQRAPIHWPAIYLSGTRFVAQEQGTPT